MDSGILGLLLSLMAGLATTIGSLIVFCLKDYKILPFAICMAMSAGVMMYVSMVELLAVARTNFNEGFRARGVEAQAAQRWAYACATATFFAGWLATVLVDKLTHFLMHITDQESPSRSTSSTRNADKVPDAGTTGGGLPISAELAMLAIEKAVRNLELPSITIQESESKFKLGVDDDGSAERMTTEDAESTQLTNSSKVELAPTNRLAGPKKHNRSFFRCFQEELAARDYEAIAFAERQFQRDQENFTRLGFFTALALGIHNFPEGVATFTGALANPSFGAGIAVAVGIHNVPEGFAVAVPIYFGTGSKWKGFLFSFLSGIAEPIGAFVAYLALGRSEDKILFGILFGMIGGVMTNISLTELYPTAIKYDPTDRAVSRSFFFAMLVMAASLVGFEFAGSSNVS